MASSWQTGHCASAIWKFLSAFALALLIAGCSAGPELPAFEAASSERALIRWHRKGVSLVCDAVCARSSNGTVLVRLYKQSPTPLAEFRLEPGNYFIAKGRLAGRGWAGDATVAPAVYSCWIAFLGAYQGSPSLRQQGTQEVQIAAIRVAYINSGKKSKTLSVSNTDRGEVISAVFN